MQATFLKVIGATLIAATTVQMAGAAEHHARKAKLNGDPTIPQQQCLRRTR
jgi:hypothetical protein